MMQKQTDPQFDQRTVKQLVQELANVQKLDPKVVKEIGKVFNCGLGTDQQYLRKKIKSKICDIILEQRQGYLDYLNLKKFQTLSQDSKKYLKDITTNIWEKFQIKSRINFDKQRQKDLGRLMPSFNSLSDYQGYHLNLLSIYRQSGCFPQKQLNSINLFRHQQAMETFPNQYQYLMNFPFQPSLHPFNETNLQDFQNLYNMLPPNNSLECNFPPKIPPMKQSPNPFNNTYNDYHYQQSNYIHQPLENPFHIKRNDIPIIQKQISDKIVEKITKTYQKNNQQQMIEIKGFEQCFCKGLKKYDKLKYFQCSSCKKNYHYQCLRVSAIKLKRVKCPICIITQPTTLTKVIHVIDANWIEMHSEKQIWKFKLFKEMIKIPKNKQKQYQLQLRFLSINGLSQFNNDQQDIVVQNQIKKISCIPLLIDLLTFQQFQIQLSFKQLNQMNNERFKLSQIFYIGIYLVQIQSIQNKIKEIIQAQQNHVSKQYLDTFVQRKIQQTQPNIKRYITVSLLNQQTNKAIQIPARGNKCHHFSVFDLKSFFKSNIKATVQIPKCPICNKKCQRILIDDFIKSLIKPNSQGLIPYEFKYYTNGEVEYDKKGIKQNNQNEQSSLLSQIGVQNEYSSEQNKKSLSNPLISQDQIRSMRNQAKSDENKKSENSKE